MIYSTTLSKFLSFSTGMDVNKELRSSVFDRLSTEESKRLKPQSSRIVTSDHKANLHHLRGCPDSFINLQVQVANSSATKRKLDDSGLEFSYETPAKKSSSCSTLSPDHGCVLDYCSSPEKQGPFVFKEKLVVVDPRQHTSSSKDIASPLPNVNKVPRRSCPKKRRISLTTRRCSRSQRYVSRPKAEQEHHIRNEVEVLAMAWCL